MLFATDLESPSWLRTDRWILSVCHSVGDTQGNHMCSAGSKGTAWRNVTRNHKAGPNMGDGNSGSILDFESPQNTLKYKRVFSDPKTRKEVSRVSECLRSQATSPPLPRLPGDQADSSLVHPTPGVLTATWGG